MPDLNQVVTFPVRRIELGFGFEQAARIAEALRPHVPGIALEAVRRIEKELPDFVRPHDPRYSEGLGLSVEYAIGHFLDLMADPGIGSADVLAFWREIGAGEAREGRPLDSWHTATRIGAGVAVERLTERAEELGYRPGSANVAAIANAVFGYLNQLAVVVAEGHADVEARAAGLTKDLRQNLVDRLLSDPVPDPRDLKGAAREAGWALPRTVAAVPLHERGPETRRPALPPDVLLGLHLPDACLIVPDPEGPGRAQLLEQQLRDWTVAIGPTVEISELGTSLRWARRALALADEGLIDGAKPIIAERHMPMIVLMRDRDLVERVIERRLAPLLAVRSQQRYRLAETLLTALECGFNATEVAGRLHLHAQTVRYRIRRLEELFGSTLQATSGRLELHMVLQAWLALNQEPAVSELRTG
ncbi:helix-turn-helix domain-containing protein [Actinocorallia longicatena]|uniref:PucR family transcriptional regulator n=1 Tax=Actinocorallia longicatena TaxID=111803 RepID=A0ABP6QIQ4_9ACTN